MFFTWLIALFLVLVFLQAAILIPVRKKIKKKTENAATFVLTQKSNGQNVKLKN